MTYTCVERGSDTHATPVTTVGDHYRKRGTKFKPRHATHATPPQSHERVGLDTRWTYRTLGSTAERPVATRPRGTGLPSLRVGITRQRLIQEMKDVWTNGKVAPNRVWLEFMEASAPQLFRVPIPSVAGTRVLMTVQDKIDTKFLKDTVADVVVKACSACAVARPDDPVGFVAGWLEQFVENDAILKKRVGELTVKAAEETADVEVRHETTWTLGFSSGAKHARSRSRACILVHLTRVSSSPRRASPDSEHPLFFSRFREILSRIL